MDPLQRRAVLSAIAVVGSGAVGGCFGDGDGTGGSGNDGDGNSSSETDPDSTNGTDGPGPPTIDGTVEPTFAGKFTPDGAAEYARFGWSLDAAGSLLLVGADRDGGPTPTGPATASLYEWTGGEWRQRTSFTARAVGDGFAHDLALTRSTAVVGVPHDNGPDGLGAGSARVFERSGESWAASATLDPGEAGENAAFGTSVAASGDTLLIGAPGESSLYGIDSGGAYAFRRDGGDWPQEAKLKANSGDRADIFGQAVALGAGGDVAVVGAPRASDRRGNEAGRTFVFERTDGDWRQRQTLFAGNSRDGGRFGWAVAASGDRLVVGAPGAGSPGGSGAGEAYVFAHTPEGWEQTARLTDGDDPEDPRGFGFSVAMLGPLVAVGSPLADAPAPDDEGDPVLAEGGRATVFQRLDGEWGNRGTIVGDYVKADDHSGWDVALTAERALTGTPLHERPAGQDVGTVQYFDF